MGIDSYDGGAVDGARQNALREKRKSPAATGRSLQLAEAGDLCASSAEPRGQSAAGDDGGAGAARGVVNAERHD